MSKYDTSQMNEDYTSASKEVEYDSKTGAYRVKFSYGSDPPSLVLCEAIASITDEDPLELEPLFDVIDPDALDSLFVPTTSGESRGDGSVSFTFHGFDVEVKSYGLIEIEPAETDEG